MTTHLDSRTRYALRIAAIVAAALLIGRPRWTAAAEPEAQTFPSAGDAAQALFQAVDEGDEARVRAILGAAGNLTSCGDVATDARDRERFARKYREMRRLVAAPDGTTVLYVGAENWPFPIPLVSSDGRWHFAAEAGRREVMFRQIGANEATAIEVARAAVRAHERKAPSASDDPIVRYAEALVADGPGERPFHGYRFVLRKTGGLTIVAYPDDYRSSGVMTFVVGQDGVVYERDLGPDTIPAARGLKARPESGWRVVG